MFRRVRMALKGRRGNGNPCERISDPAIWIESRLPRSFLIASPPPPPPPSPVCAHRRSLPSRRVSPWRAGGWRLRCFHRQPWIGCLRAEGDECLPCAAGHNNRRPPPKPQSPSKVTEFQGPALSGVQGQRPWPCLNLSSLTSTQPKSTQSPAHATAAPPYGPPPAASPAFAT